MLYVIIRISKIDEDVTTWVYDNEAGAYECFSKLFRGREKDNGGDMTVFISMEGQDLIPMI